MNKYVFILFRVWWDWTTDNQIQNEIIREDKKNIWEKEKEWGSHYEYFMCESDISSNFMHI